ncbi:DJ-1/PfpI family protein [Aestuariibacter halophilus]|uniref:DJ-1/PfpI family protein n=1 Tax=Fluctibacter halophilus TaxID=226011 RepID=A0ABS8G989_9ALTE|nr:helix-turn-helix domain-containing protein [Aestuariibacter halophilus]MCC2616380.1 DJ-1/PfpI family protein [Aestuariibacter halophilus]
MKKNISILVYQGVELLDLAGPQSAFNEASHFVAGAYDIDTIGFDTAPVTCEAGLQLKPNKALYNIVDCHTLIIPGGNGARSETITPQQLADLAALMSRCERVVTICTGAFLAARAGLPPGTRVATHWAFLDSFHQQFPELQIERDKLYIRDGNYWSSAGVTSGIDLSLSLIEQDCGKAAAFHVAKYLVVYLRRAGGQKQFSDPLQLQTPKTERMAFISDWITAHVSEVISVSRLAEKLHLSERQCHRWFMQHSGHTPAQYVEKCRMQVACELLASSEQALKAIGACVGYSTYDGFKRAFERHFTVSPCAYRNAFSSRP